MDEENEDNLPVEDHQEQEGEAPGEEGDESRRRALAMELGDIMVGRGNQQGAGAGQANDEVDEVPVIDDETHEFFWLQLIEYLQGNSEDLHANIVELPFYWHEVIRQQVWDEAALEEIMGVARSSSRDFLQLEPMCVGDRAAAARTAQLVRSFPDLEYMELTDSPSNRFAQALPDSKYTAKRVNWLLDAFREQQQAPGAPPFKLSTFEFNCDCPVRPSSLVGFLESVSSTLTELKYGEYGKEATHFFDEDVAGALAGVFGRLPYLNALQLYVPFSRFIPVVIEGLVAAADLQSFTLNLHDGYSRWPKPDEPRECMKDSIKQVASLAAHCKSLRMLEFHNAAAPYFGLRYNAAPILVQAATSTSLETLSLHGFCIRCAKSVALGEKSWNESVKMIRFERCQLGTGTFALLSRFKVLTSIEFSGCDGLSRAGKCHWLLSRLPSLKSFSFEQDYEHPAVPRDSILNSIARAGRCFDLLKLDFGGSFEDYHDHSFPSLQTLMLRTAGTLHLSLGPKNSDEFLMAGIKGTTTLQKLSVRHKMAPPVLAELFKSVQVNTSLRSFTCEADLPNHEADQSITATCGNSLADLLRFNKGLRSICISIGFSDYRRVSNTIPLLNAIVLGLYYNKSIEDLDLTVRDGLWNIYPLLHNSSMLDLLQYDNTILKRIKGCDSVEYGGEEIGYYLWMNRSGRHFVRNADLITPSLLPHILSAIGKDTGEDGIRYFLRNMPPDRLVRILSARGIRRTRPASFDD